MPTTYQKQLYQFADNSLEDISATLGKALTNENI